MASAQRAAQDAQQCLQRWGLPPELSPAAVEPVLADALISRAIQACYSAISAADEQGTPLSFVDW
jgi:hypothetical protein